jgi:nucleoid-associated protein YgaU
MKRVTAIVVIAAVLAAGGVSCKSTGSTPTPPPKRGAAAEDLSGFPETLELPANLTVPREASMQAIAARYYKSMRLKDGTTVIIMPEQTPAIAERVAKFNGLPDAMAKVPGGRVLKLPRVYIVAPGDTFYGIAVRVYGDKNRVTAIEAANPDYPEKNLPAGGGVILP